MFCFKRKKNRVQFSFNNEGVGVKKENLQKRLNSKDGEFFLILLIIFTSTEVIYFFLLFLNCVLNMCPKLFIISNLIFSIDCNKNFFENTLLL